MIPENEQWIHKDPATLAAINEGLKQSEEGKVTEIDFSNHIDDAE